MKHWTITQRFPMTVGVIWGIIGWAAWLTAGWGFIHFCIWFGS